MRDAVERLRTALVDAEEDRTQYGLDSDVELSFDDARELLALHDEAVRVMGELEDACSSVASWSEECVDYSDPARVAVRAFLERRAWMLERKLRGDR